MCAQLQSLAPAEQVGNGEKELKLVPYYVGTEFILLACLVERCVANARPSGGWGKRPTVQLQTDGAGTSTIDRLLADRVRLVRLIGDCSVQMCLEPTAISETLSERRTGTSYRGCV